MPLKNYRNMKVKNISTPLLLTNNFTNYTLHLFNSFTLSDETLSFPSWPSPFVPAINKTCKISLKSAALHLHHQNHGLRQLCLLPGLVYKPSTSMYFYFLYCPLWSTMYEVTGAIFKNVKWIITLHNSSMDFQSTFKLIQTLSIQGVSMAQ